MKTFASAFQATKIRCRFYLIILLISGSILVLLSSLGTAEEIRGQITKTQDDIMGAKEASTKVLGKKGRWAPIPIPISNPTLGTGLALSLVYLHPQKSTNAEAPTSTSGIMGMYTDSESWAIGALHDGYYRDDWIRLRFPVVYGEFNLDFYGIGNDSPLKDKPLKYSAKGTGVLPRVLFRLPGGNWFFGGEYTFFDIETSLDFSKGFPQLPTISLETRTAGIGLVSVYDSRDSNYWPAKGNWLEFTATKYGAYAGGDFEYYKVITKWVQYFPLIDTVTLAYRLDWQFVDGDAPFWDLAQARLRGYSGGQLIDAVAATAQTEVRWNFHQRWIALAFIGGSRIAKTVGDLGSEPTYGAGGGGLKYMLIEEQKLSIGLDVAFAEGGDFAVYFQVGDWLAN